MSSEIEVTETPNWLQELEAKRERRLKARLGHEAGAGAPCLKCGEKCPGLDLHFWRKCCKICKCAKEEHEVHDDDIYGWAQFQLLGSKPNKLKRKIVLPGKKDEVELDWTPKGHTETVDKYLKTLPPEQLPVKGSQAAQDRKQLLQKQIPIHDIDPTLCHELSNEELKQMNDYITHVKQSSVGVGQIVSLSNLIKANLHMLNPSEAALIASRYPKGIPLSEIVKLQSQSRANALKQQGLSKKLGELKLQDLSNKNLPNYNPNASNICEEGLNPWVTNNLRDINYSGYTEDLNQTPINPQFSTKFKPGQNRGYLGNTQNEEEFPPPPPSLDEKFVQNPNFDPKKVPSQFWQQKPFSPYKIGQQDAPHNEYYDPGTNPDQINSAFVPYNKISSSPRPGEKYTDDNPARSANYTSSLPRYGAKSPSGYRPGEIQSEKLPSLHGKTDETYIENSDPLNPNFVRNLSKYPSGHKSAIDDQTQHFGTPGLNSGNNAGLYENVESLKRGNKQGLPNYVPGKYNVHSETLSPSKLPRNVRDIAFSTFNPNDPNVNVPENNQYKESFDKIRNISPFDPNSVGLKPSQYAYSKDLSSSQKGAVPLYGQTDIPPPYSDENHPSKGTNIPFTNPAFGQNSSGPNSGQFAGQSPSRIPGKQNLPPYKQFDVPPPYSEDNVPCTNPAFGKNSSGPNSGQLAGQSPSRIPGNQNVPPYKQFDVPPPYLEDNVLYQGKNVPYTRTHLDQNASGPRSGPYGAQNLSTIPGQSGVPPPYSDKNIPSQGKSVPYTNTSLDQNSSGPGSGQYGGQNPSYKNVPALGQYDVLSPYPGENDLLQGTTVPYTQTPLDQNSSGVRYGQYSGENISDLPLYDSNIPPQGNNLRFDQNTSGLSSGQYAGLPTSPSNVLRPNKKLSELHPGKITVDEDYLEPSQVNIGAIQDINYPEIKAAVHGTNDFYEDYSPESLREIINNVKLPDCHYCKKPFEENEFAVTIDRANVLFHAQCFKCAGCNQILADNVYFYNKETDNIYCGRDYAKIRGFPRCKACDELIFTKEYCLAENNTFHLKHFCCMECDKPLAGQDYTLEDEMPFCLPCFEQSKASKCSSCGRVIKPDETGCNLNGVHFHAVDECFACKVCKKPLMGKKLLLRDEKLYCSHDCFGSDKK